MKSDTKPVMIIGMLIFFFTIPDREILKESYEIAIKSGMLENCKVTTSIEGVLNVMGREIPLNIHIKIEIEGTEN